MADFTRTSASMDGFAQDQLNRILGNWKLTPATFAHGISRGRWIPSPHLLYISSRVAKAVAKGNARMILSMPPRHGKSELISINTSAWLLEYIGQLNIILASYGSDLAVGFVRQVRQIIADKNNHGLLNVRLGQLKQAEKFSTSLGGYMYGVGLGGVITGRGAHVLLIDDYIKEIKEALSPTHREYVWNWYVTTARTRLEPGGSIIIVATRWHSDDLIGRLLKNEPDDWEYIELPAIALENDILGRQPGDALFPQRYNIEALHKLKKTLGTIYFEALFQQRPVDETIRITDPRWLQKWPHGRPLPTGMRYARIWDLAATQGGGDWLTGTLVGYHDDSANCIILDIYRAQLGPGDIEDAVVAIAELDGYGVTIGIEQEPGSAGKILNEHYAKNVLPGYDVVSISTGGKAKVIRAQPFLAAAEAGNVWYLEDDPSIPAEEGWNKVFQDEFEIFPAAATNHTQHDDTIDTSAEGYTLLTGKRALQATWGAVREGMPKSSNAIWQRPEMADASPTPSLIANRMLGRQRLIKPETKKIIKDRRPSMSIIAPSRGGATW
jgi:hypothetical protein